MRRSPFQLQQNTLNRLLKIGEGTIYGELFGIHRRMTEEKFASNVPLINYEDLDKYIDSMLSGAENVLSPKRVKTYAQSSGTTNDRSKYIPMPNSMHYKNHVACSWDTMAIVYNEDPNCQIFQEKSTIMGGSLKKFKESEVGDVSAILLNKMHWAGRPFFTPDFETAKLADWEDKIYKMSHLCKDENVVMLGGVPTWTLVLCHKILEVSGKNNMLEVWPNLKYYMHGGVGFDPYRTQFKELFPAEDFKYYEIYNASEGYFAVNDSSESDGMLLLLGNDIYYEFINMEIFNSQKMTTTDLKDVKIGVNYAMVITTSAGLWRYIIGDTITFTSINPFRIKVTGRTKQHINVFGEEVMVANTDTAIKMTCDEYDTRVNEYTVAPIYMSNDSKGGHLWIIEFSQAPKSIKMFEKSLDDNLRSINSDYDAKRQNNMAMKNLEIKVVPIGTFHEWMKSRGKYGGQNKVPRLSNKSIYIDGLLKTAMNGFN